MSPKPALWALPLLLLPALLQAQEIPTPTPIAEEDRIPDPPQEGPAPIQEGAQAPVLFRYFVGLGVSMEYLWGGFDGDTLRVTGQSVSILSPRLDPGPAIDLYGGLKGPRLPEPFGELWIELSDKLWAGLFREL